MTQALLSSAVSSAGSPSFPGKLAAPSVTVRVAPGMGGTSRETAAGRETPRDPPRFGTRASCPCPQWSVDSRGFRRRVCRRGRGSRWPESRDRPFRRSDQARPIAPQASTRYWPCRDGIPATTAEHTRFVRAEHARERMIALQGPAGGAHPRGGHPVSCAAADDPRRARYSRAPNSTAPNPRCRAGGGSIRSGRPDARRSPVCRPGSARSCGTPLRLRPCPTAP